VKKETRKNSTPIKVYCLPEEKKQIEDKAAQAGLSVSKYLLKVGVGYKLKGILDHRRVNDLARINGDLGRLGGLLKLWLTHDDRVKNFDTKTILKLLSKIETTQDGMREIMKTVVKQ
jgi:hypothetical protein